MLPHIALFGLAFTGSLATAAVSPRSCPTPNGISITDMNMNDDNCPQPYPQPHPHPQTTNAGDPEQQNPCSSTEPQDHIPFRYYGISLNINLHKIGRIPSYGRAPVELNKLAPYTLKASQIIFDPGAAVNVDVKSVACQAFKDTDGAVPLGVEFSLHEPLQLARKGEKLVQVGSLICYVSGNLLKDIGKGKEDEGDE